MYRLIALDVDGTLLDSQHRLAPEVRDAIHQAQERGALVCLATGKLLASVTDLTETLHLTGPQITCNGAALMDATTGEAIQSWPIDGARAKPRSQLSGIARQARRSPGTPQTRSIRMPLPVIWTASLPPTMSLRSTTSRG